MREEHPRSIESPLVSIIIPCYNHARFLPQAIESALAQTHGNFEIIVVDDGSKDNTSEVAGSYPKVRCVRQKNQGLSAARNTGIRESSGSYLVFLDADDRLLPAALEAGVKCFEANPESAFVFGRYLVMDEDGVSAPASSKPFEGGDYYRGLLRRNYIGMVSTVMFRRRAFESVGDFNASISPTADYDIYLRVARLFPIASHNEVVAEYRVYEASMSHDHGVMLRAVTITLRSQRQHIKGNKEQEEAYRRGFRYWRSYYGEMLYARVGNRMWRLKEWRRTIRGLWHLALYYPQALTVHGRNRLSKLAARFGLSVQLSHEPESPFE